MRRCESGLTLLEVVLSMAVLSIVSLSFLNFFASGFGAIVQAGRISHAAALAQEKMEELRVNTYGELLQMGMELSDGNFPCPTAAVSSSPISIIGYDEYQRFYRIACHALEFDGYLLQGLSLEVVVQQGEGRKVAGFTSFVPKD